MTELFQEIIGSFMKLLLNLEKKSKTKAHSRTHTYLTALKFQEEKSEILTIKGFMIFAKAWNFE